MYLILVVRMSQQKVKKANSQTQAKKMVMVMISLAIKTSYKMSKMTQKKK